MYSQRLRHVFNIDIEVCGHCGGAVRVIVDASNRCIEDQEAVDRILNHLRQKGQETLIRPLLLVPATEPRQARCLLSRERSLPYHSAISRDATE
jgi:hypothetical protein